MARTDEQFDRFIESTRQQLGRLIRKPQPLDMSHAALMVIDMQNNFVHPEGSVYLSSSRHIIKRIRRLQDLFHKRNRPVIFTRHQHAPDNSDTGVMDLWWSGSHIYRDTWASEIVDKLEVTGDDITVSKNRYSAFHGTNLREILRQHSVSQLVITGVMTNLCCETTAREAFMNDYLVYFCLDGTTTATEDMHVASIRNLAYGFAYVVTAGEILEQFAG
jgi:isochorismate hydrolase